MQNVPPAALDWLARVAGDHNEGATAFELWDRAVQQGAYPRGANLARAAYSLGLTNADTARDYLLAHPDDHPLHSAVLSALNGDSAGTIAALAAWQPAEQADMVFRQLLLAASYSAQGDSSRAINTALEAFEDSESTGAALAAARFLLARAMRNDSISRITDTIQAAELAIAARDRRREWGGDAAEAVEVAAIALQLSNDRDRAWAVTQMPPAGEATVGEAEDVRVIAQAGLAAAMTGRVEQAQRYAVEALDGFARAHVEAVVAEWIGDLNAARDAWLRGWEAAITDVERMQAASGLVHAGGALPDLGEAAEAFPEMAKELKALAEANAAADPIVYLRAHAHMSPGLLVELAARLRDSRKQAEAAEALEAGATRWSHPELMAMAARAFMEADEGPKAIVTARKAINLGGSQWTGRNQMLKLIVQAESTAERWAEAADAARQIVTDYPKDIDAQWALTITLFNATELDKAWSALTSRGRPLLPRSRSEVMTWLRLNSRYSTDPTFIDEAFDTVRHWSEDEGVFGTFVQVMLSLGQSGLTVPEAQSQQIRESLEQFTQKFPESPFLRTMQLGPENDPLGPMQDMLREASERSAEAERQVAAGEAPLGILSMAVGRPYAEASLRRAANGVLAEMPTRPEDEESAAADAGKTTCVVDATTAHTLALLDESIRTVLLGYCSSIVVTDSVYRDALATRDALRLKSTMTISWDSVTNRPIVHEVSEEQAELLADRADVTLQILGSVTRQSHPTLNHFPEDLDNCKAWLSTLDLAKTSGYLLWCDDRVLRRIAYSMGIKTFGTVALLDVLKANGTLKSDQADLAYATLLHNFYFDLDFNPGLYSFAASLDAYHPAAVAAAVRRPAAWTPDPVQTANFVLDMVRRAADSSPEDLQWWCHAAATGLLAIAAGEPEKCSSNLAALLQQFLREAWCDAARLPFALRGIRAAMTASNEQPLRDPLEYALRQLYSVAVKQLGHSVAKAYLLELVAQGTQTDKQTAARVILTDRS